jgi:hypothetical protein
MRIFNAPTDRKMLPTTFIAIVSGLAALAGCAADTNPVRDTAAAVGLGPTITPAPAFVAQSRPESLDYIPVGTAAPGRPTPARTANEVKAAEAELDAVRASNEAAAKAAQQSASAPPAPVPIKPRPARRP